MDLDLQGNIERFTLPEIFQLVSSGRKTGTLGIQYDSDIVMVYFKNGSVIYGYGPRKTYHIGRLLVESSRITPDQLDQAITEQSRKESVGKRLGQIMLDKQFIDRADLEDVITRQVKELIYSLMSWEHGSFKFYENQFPTEEEITVNLSTENVVLEGLRRLDEITRIKDCLPDFKAVFALEPSQPGQKRDIALDTNEWNVLALVDGHRDINEITEASPLESVQTLQCLASLQLAGLIVPCRKSGGEQKKLEEMVDRLSHLIEDYLTVKSDKNAAPVDKINK